MDLFAFLADLPSGARILAIVLLAVLAHFLVRGLQRLGEWLLTPRGTRREVVATRYPRFATITTIVVSALTFIIYFAAIGLILTELGISLTAYFASASVIGLAVGFGSQGLVQDVVIGLTLIFSDVLNVGDVVDLSGQTGRVQKIGLRFTVLLNLLSQQVYVPNRNIAQINRYRNGYVRAYVDVQLPGEANEANVLGTIGPIAKGMHAQHGAVILTEPELMGVRQAAPGPWQYLRIKFRLGPGQGPLIETTFKQRVLAAMKTLNPDYADWMITVTYRAV